MREQVRIAKAIVQDTITFTMIKVGNGLKKFHMGSDVSRLRKRCLKRAEAITAKTRLKRRLYIQEIGFEAAAIISAIATILYLINNWRVK